VTVPFRVRELKRRLQMKLLSTVVLLILVLTGCSSIDLKQYRENTPQFDLFEYFTGKTTGWGIVQDRKGVLLRQFVVDISGEVKENGQLVLTENFDWSDGEQSERVWVLTQTDKHTLIGTADDVPDPATGVLYGNVLNWKYRVNLKIDDSTWEITFDDWMFKVSEDMLINKATMSKFGIDVGDVTIVFRK
jgi:hypothetical protein